MFPSIWAAHNSLLPSMSYQQVVWKLFSVFNGSKCWANHHGLLQSYHEIPLAGWWDSPTRYNETQIKEITPIQLKRMQATNVIAALKKSFSLYILFLHLLSPISLFIMLLFHLFYSNLTHYSKNYRTFLR